MSFEKLDRDRKRSKDTKKASNSNDFPVKEKKPYRKPKNAPNPWNLSGFELQE